MPDRGLRCFLNLLSYKEPDGRLGKANLNTEVRGRIKNQQLAKQVEKAILTDMLPENSWVTGPDTPGCHASFYKRLKIRFRRLFPLEALL